MAGNAGFNNHRYRHVTCEEWYLSNKIFVDEHISASFLPRNEGKDRHRRTQAHATATERELIVKCVLCWFAVGCLLVEEKREEKRSQFRCDFFLVHDCNN